MVFKKQMSMPVTSRDHLAVRFRQNWQAKHPMDICSNGGLNLDDSLTSLNWLQNLNIMKFATPTPPPSPGPRIENHIDIDLKVNPNSILNMLPNAPVKVEPLPQIGDVGSSTSLSETVDYKSNPYIKPPYSYATLICMAMKDSKKSKMTLSAIYNWITDNFIYYRMADPSWQNSIRHNLSLNKCFQKVPRRKDEPGKGGFWRVNPEYSDLFENGILKKRRGSSPAISPPFKRIKHEDDSSSSSSCAYESGRVVWNRGHNVLQVVAPDDDDQVIGDFNWTSILNQDIEIGGVRIKTERLLDESDYASPIIAMSPPSSESNSEDLGIEELLSQTDFSQDIADFSASSPLDLTITGTSLRAPQWWSECMENAEHSDILASNNNDDSGLHTPIPASPLCYTDINHPWADESGIDQSSMAAFDVDNLFDIDNVPSPHML